MKRISIDLETGGQNPIVHPILSIGFVVVNSSFATVEKGEILIQANREDCTEEALAKNGIDLEQHNLKALSLEKGIDFFDAVLNKHFPEKIYLIGQNLNFDTTFLEQAFFKVKKYYFRDRISHKIVDLMQFWRVLQAISVVKNDSAGLDNILDYLKLKDIGKRHSALVDATNVVRVLRFLKKKFGSIEI